MEKDNPSDTKGEATQRLKQGRPNVKTKKKTGQAKASKNKTPNNKKWSLWRHWKQASKRQRVKWVFEGLGAVTVVVLAVVGVIGLLQAKWLFWAEHKPLVIHNRPPEFLQTFACRVGAGFQFGNVDKIYKNIGNRTAYNVFPLLSVTSRPWCK